MNNNNKNNIDNDFGFIGGYNPFDKDYTNNDFFSDNYNINSNNNTDPYVSDPELFTEDNNYINSYDNNTYSSASSARYSHTKNSASKKPIDKPVIGVILFFALCMFLGAFVTLMSTTPRSSEYNSFMSNAVEIIAKCSNVQVVHGNYNYDHYADISYTYNGQIYTDKHVLIGHEVSNGESIKLFIDPANPKRVIKDGNQTTTFKIEFTIGYVLLAIGTLLTIVVIAAIIYNIRYKSLYGSNYETTFKRTLPRKPAIKSYNRYDKSNNHQKSYSDNNLMKTTNITTKNIDNPDHIYNDSYTNKNRTDSVQKDSASSKSVRKMVIIIVIIAITVFSILNGIHIFPAIFTKLDNDKFMETAVAAEGECTYVRVEKVHRDRTTRYTYYARISYNYNGQNYVSQELIIPNGIAKGEKYTVYIDPQKPVDSRIPYVLNMFDVYTYSVSMVVELVIGIAIIIVTIRSGKNNKKNN